MRPFLQLSVNLLRGRSIPYVTKAKRTKWQVTLSQPFQERVKGFSLLQLVDAYPVSLPVTYRERCVLSKRNTSRDASDTGRLLVLDYTDQARHLRFLYSLVFSINQCDHSFNSCWWSSSIYQSLYRHWSCLCTWAHISFRKGLSARDLFRCVEPSRIWR